MLQSAVPSDYVIATGEMHSVREFCEIAFSRVGLDYQDFVRTDPSSNSTPERVPLVGNVTKAKSELGWNPTVTFEQLVCSMVDADVDLLAREGLSNFEKDE